LFTLKAAEPLMTPRQLPFEARVAELNGGHGTAESAQAGTPGHRPLDQQVIELLRAPRLKVFLVEEPGKCISPGTVRRQRGRLDIPEPRIV